MNKNLFFAGVGLASSCISVNAMGAGEKILSSPLPGSWYEADPGRLRGQIQQWMKAASVSERRPDAAPAAIVSPHAGYAYSGLTAAFSYKTLAGRKYDRVIILGPSHRVYLKNQICIPAAAGLQTPLGVVRTDSEVLRSLARLPFVKVDDSIHFNEHSVQIQLPFLQTACDGPFQIVPVVVGMMDNEAVRKAAQALSAHLTKSTLVVISSDFTHFGRAFGYTPFKDDFAKNIRKLDLDAFELIRPGNAVKFARYIQETGSTICGEAPIRILLEMLPRQTETVLLHYANSADDNGDYSHCVSYVAGAVYCSWTPAEKAADRILLPDADRLTLLKMARESIALVFKTCRSTPASQFSDRATDAVKRKMGCFVTLKIGDDLRGCIGEIEPFRPLYQAVTERAVDSAFRDPRFPQLTPEEFKRVEIEISALTPSRPVQSYREIEIGRHGMTITLNGRSAVFLPQVATEQGWNLEETLTSLSRKAGLAPDAWKSPDAKFTVFEAIVFRESDFRETER